MGGEGPPRKRFKPEIMALNLEIIGGLVKLYGAPLYGSAPVKDAGSLTPEEYELIDGDTLLTIIEGNTVYIPIRRSVVEAGIPENRVFNIGIFEALRDADGVGADGKAWTVSKGQQKVFAY